MRLGRSRSRWTWLLALGALIGALTSGDAAADDVADQPLELRLTVITIGAHGVLIVDEAGIAMMYEDPTVSEPNCGEREVCWGFEAKESAGVVIQRGGSVVEGVDTASGNVFQEIVPAPP